MTPYPPARGKARWIRNPGREQNEGERQSENSCLGPRRLPSYYKAIVVGVYVSTDPSESRSISQPLWAMSGPSEGGGIRVRRHLAHILNPLPLPPPPPPLPLNTH